MIFMSNASISVDELLSRSVAEVIDKNHLKKRLQSGQVLRIKLGIDPTGREIHLGHAVPIRLLRRFQLLGHKVVFIVGDFTAMIGDPSGKTEARAALSFEQTRKNSKTYFDQAFKILDPDETEIHYNSEWFHDFDLKKVIHLLSNASVAQLLAHETFRDRLKKEQPFFAHEILYPLLQAYDSVAVKADVEVGGLDQKFNLLMGREVQRAYGMEAQDIILLEYLIGTDGKEKMSKSLGNYIAIDCPPAEMFGKVMSISDHLIVPYFTLATDVTDEALVLIKKELAKAKGETVRDVKMRLAKTIVELYHGAEAAEEAQDAFKVRFQQSGGGPVVVDREVTVKRGPVKTTDLLLEVGLARSKSEAFRKLSEGAVALSHGQGWTKAGETVTVDRPMTIRLGKRFVRVVSE